MASIDDRTYCLQTHLLTKETQQLSSLLTDLSHHLLSGSNHEFELCQAIIPLLISQTAIGLELTSTLQRRLDLNKDTSGKISNRLHSVEARQEDLNKCGTNTTITEIVIDSAIARSAQQGSAPRLTRNPQCISAYDKNGLHTAPTTNLPIPTVPHITPPSAQYKKQDVSSKCTSASPSSRHSSIPRSLSHDGISEQDQEAAETSISHSRPQSQDSTPPSSEHQSCVASSEHTSVSPSSRHSSIPRSLSHDSISEQDQEAAETSTCHSRSQSRDNTPPSFQRQSCDASSERTSASPSSRHSSIPRSLSRDGTSEQDQEAAETSPSHSMPQSRDSTPPSSEHQSCDTSSEHTSAPPSPRHSAKSRSLSHNDRSEQKQEVMVASTTNPSVSTVRDSTPPSAQRQNRNTSSDRASAPPSSTLSSTPASFPYNPLSNQDQEGVYPSTTSQQSSPPNDICNNEIESGLAQNLVPSIQPMHLSSGNIPDINARSGMITRSKAALMVVGSLKRPAAEQASHQSPKKRATNTSSCKIYPLTTRNKPRRPSKQDPIYKQASFKQDSHTVRSLTTPKEGQSEEEDLCYATLLANTIKANAFAHQFESLVESFRDPYCPLDNYRHYGIKQANIPRADDYNKSYQLLDHLKALEYGYIKKKSASYLSNKRIWGSCREKEPKRQYQRLATALADLFPNRQNYGLLCFFPFERSPGKQRNITKTEITQHARVISTKFRMIVENDTELQHLAGYGDMLISLIMGLDIPIPLCNGVIEFQFEVDDYTIEKEASTKSFCFGTLELTPYPAYCLPSDEAFRKSHVPKNWTQLERSKPRLLDMDSWPGELLEVYKSAAFEAGEQPFCSICGFTFKALEDDTSCDCLDKLRAKPGCRIMRYSSHRCGIQVHSPIGYDDGSGHLPIVYHQGEVVGECIGRFEPYECEDQFKTAVPFQHPHSRGGPYYQLSFKNAVFSNWARHLKYGDTGNAKVEVRAISGSFSLLVIATKDLQHGDEVVVTRFDGHSSMAGTEDIAETFESGSRASSSESFDTAQLSSSSQHTNTDSQSSLAESFDTAHLTLTSQHTSPDDNNDLDDNGYNAGFCSVFHDQFSRDIVNINRTDSF